MKLSTEQLTTQWILSCHDRINADLELHKNMRLGERLFLKMMRAFERVIIKHSLVGDYTFFDKAVYPWISQLEASTEIIKQELAKAMPLKKQMPRFDEVIPEQTHINQDDDWKVYAFLCAYGKWNETAAIYSPKTAALLKKIPGIRTAFFSILEPGKQIPAHTGPYRGVLRVHLGVDIPTDSQNCTITVGAETRCWQQGKCLVFDDGYLHHVYNNTSEQRVVLFLDVERPMPWPYALFNKLIIYLLSQSPIAIKATENMNAWYKRNYKRGNK